MSFPSNVERWRDTVVAHFFQAQDMLSFDPLTYFEQENLTIEQFIDYVLGIIEQESGGNQFCLGDLRSGQSISHQPVNIMEATAWSDRANSIGLMQLNYGVGTPQDLGYTGDKNGLFDPSTNILYGMMYFMTKIRKYIADYNTMQEALSAYNAGHAIEANKASYVDAIVQFISDAVGSTTSGEKKTLV
jgi:soluble lytic murein transglycosylase-like protein